MEDVRTDRAHLTTHAYGTDANLAARQSIYRYLDPPTSFFAWALDHVTWDGVRTVVDVGCGNGGYFGNLRERIGGTGTIVGFDLSAGMLASALHDGALLAVADAQAIALPDDSVDVALAMHMLYHVADLEAAVRELRRALRPGGVLLAATNGEPHLHELGRVFREAAELGDDEPLTMSRWGFSLEGGEPMLRAAFDDVRRADLPRALVVPDLEPVLAYVNSARSWREPLLREGLTWEACMERIRTAVAERIAREGAFRITAHAGVFICR